MMLIPREKTGTALNTDDNRLSRWTISDYYRDSFVHTAQDTPPTANDSMFEQEQDRDSIMFRHSRYDGLFDDDDDGDDALQQSPVLARNRRWSEETEDVPDRNQSYRVVARLRANNQQPEEWDEESIRFRHSRYEHLFDNNDSDNDSIPRDVAAAMGRSRRVRWTEEVEDIPDRHLTYGRQQSQELPRPVARRDLRWSGETEDVPDRHPRYRRS